MGQIGNQQAAATAVATPPVGPARMPLGSALGPPYPPHELLLSVTYCIHSHPSLVQLITLAFQHYIVMLGTTVLIANAVVPPMGGTNGDKAHVIQTLLFMAGINTLLQTWLGSRLPAVMGPSYAFMIPVTSIITDYSLKDFSSEHERFRHTLRAIQGALIVSSCVGILLGYARVWSRLTKLISPVVVVPFVCVVGLGLFTRGFAQLANCIELGLPMLILLVVSQQHLKQMIHAYGPAIEKFALLFCIAFIWIFATILTAAGAYNHSNQTTKSSCRVDSSHLLSSAPWIKIPYPFQYGTPIFRASDVFGMMGAAFVTSAESTAAFYAASRLAGATAPPAHVLTRSIGLQGVSLMLDGFFGAAVGTTVSVENVGLLGLTKVGSRRVVQVSTLFMLLFSIIGKFGALFASIPSPVFAAAYCVLWGIVAATGISFVQFANKNSLRNMYVLGIPLFLGISIPYYFWNYTASTNHGPVNTSGGWFNDILNTIFSSPATVALIVGVILDNTVEAGNTADRGIAWWKPFQDRHGEPRNEEFYSFPLNLDDYLPKDIFPKLFVK